MFLQRAVLVSVVGLVFVSAVDNGLGLTPAMGYNTWNDFRCDNITAVNIKLVADKMKAMGLDKVGYQYINIDDCWAVSRDSNNVIVPDPAAFPDGMKAVADYVHSQGFKFGIYSDRGNFTCAQRPGSLTFETIDANTYASWGVDYLKEDSCYASSDHDTAFANYETMRDALNKTGRPIYFSLCGWSNWYAPVGWGIANSWRIGGDVNEWQSAWNAISINRYLASYARPGGWNDPDMLVGSNPKAAVSLTPVQSRTQFTLWAVMAAPLLIGSNILSMSDFDLETYSNTEVIAVDQDELGIQGDVVWQNCPVVELEILRQEAQTRKFSAVPPCQQIWAKRLVGNTFALAFANFDSADTTLQCDAHCLQSLGFKGAVHVRDLWEHQDLGALTSIQVAVPGSGGSVLLRLSDASVEPADQALIA